MLSPGAEESLEVEDDCSGVDDGPGVGEDWPGVDELRLALGEVSASLEELGSLEVGDREDSSPGLDEDRLEAEEEDEDELEVSSVGGTGKSLHWHTSGA